MTPMRRIAALSIALLVPVAIVACSPPAQPPPKDPGHLTSASAAASSADAPAPSVDPAAGDPRIVRCGVDDRPKNVVGALDRAPFPFADAAATTTPSPFLGMGLGGPSKIMVAKPRPPSVRTVPLARPRTSTLFEGASRGGSPLEEPAKTAAVGRRFDISECIGEAGITKGNVVIQLRVASTGAPLEARPKTSDLDERMTHCVVELGCQLSLPATPTTGDLEIRASLSQIAPVFKGNVSVSPSTEGAYVEAMQPALTKLGQTIKPLAEECAKKQPPAQTVSFLQRLTVDDGGFLSLVPPTIGGATEALMVCLAPRLHDGVGPIAPALRKSAPLRTSFTFVVSPSP